VVKEGRFAISVNVRTTRRGLELDRIEVYSGTVNQLERHLAGEEGLFTQAQALAAAPYGLNMTAFACSDPAVSIACVVSISTLSSALSHQGTTIVLALLLSMMVGLAASRAVRHIQQHRASVRGRIVRGVKKKSGFFCLYQPIVEMDSGQIIGCEVLARFEDSIGPLYPDVFIPMIEKANLTWPFTQQIIGQALASLGPLCKERPDFKVSVNFYPKDLQERHLGRISDDKALCAAARDGMPVNCEILETGIGEAEDLTPVIAFLHQQGFTVAIDDFGTGYSNLSQLSLIDAEYLKIDKSFVQGLNRQEASVRSSLVPHILEIAKIVKIDVIAEGIETKEHLDVLRGMGVRYGQGFLFSRPVPLEELVDLVQRGMKAAVG
jgi:sensor c-di-GMP phosphodiesterase-like protein